jgi:hypothetical protein
MTDTPQHIKGLQLEIWLSKTPAERLYQFLMDNDAMYQALRKYKTENNLALEGLDPCWPIPCKKETKHPLRRSWLHESGLNTTLFQKPRA